MDLRIEYLSKEELKPYANNAKIHTAEQVEQIKKSIQEFGFNDPIAVWHDNEIVEGHGRLLAVMEMDEIDQIPVIRLDDLTDEQRKAYMLVHNKLTMNTDFDIDMLNMELEDIIDIDMEQFGFDVSLDDEPQEIVQDEMPEEVETRCKLGDIWQLGWHRLMCGSSTDKDNIAELMHGERAALLFTSPPYSDMREYEGGKDLSVENLAKFIACYRPYVDYQCINLGIQRKDNDVYEYWNEYIRIARENGYKMLSWNVWDKGMTGNIGQAAAFFPLRHEWVFVFGTKFFEINLTFEKKPESITKNPGRKTKRNKDGTTSEHTTGDTSQRYKQMESVLLMHPVLQNDLRALHPASFPVGLPAEYIKAMTQKGDAIIEPFGGSGTTLIACEELIRRCFIMELEPKYCDVIIQRWENLTGEKAVLINGK